VVKGAHVDVENLQTATTLAIPLRVSQPESRRDYIVIYRTCADKEYTFEGAQLLLLVAK